MKRVLVTGFEPFGGSTVNPSGEIVRALAAEPLPGLELRTRILPCAFGQAGRLIAAEIDEFDPDVVISFGQGGGHSVAVERVGVNIEDAGVPDNVGQNPAGTPVDPAGPAAYFATLPVKEIARALNTAGVPARLSLTAGAYVCNHVLYSSLHHLGKRGHRAKAGFIHVPKLPEQVATADFREKEPSMALGTLVQAARIVIEVAVGEPVVAPR